MRKASALIVTAGLVMTALTACAVPGTAGTSCETAATSGAASALISTSGDFGSAPDVSFPTPLKSSTTQRTQIIEGSGEKLEAGQMISAFMTMYNGTTGAAIQQAPFDGSVAFPIALADTTLPGIVAGLLCAREGERIAVVISPDDGFGPAGGSEQLQLGTTDAVVVVVDIVKAYLPRADGANQIVANGLPSVVLDENGVPGIVVPNGDAPTTLEMGVLKQGAGDKVKEGSTVTVNLAGVLWKEKTSFVSTWTNGSPVQMVPNAVIPGLATALIGQTVGSQIVAVIPPDQAYGDAVDATIPAGSTLVFVVDILGVD
ncbi:FKBP-type peptidyl-prolyl cis-trans isomerase [Cryobacterium sp. Hb1]|uniref:FKBP-type peptidyl-prolyl cis-trans isomerase n=1 Tax=Cryobacterium sp. Hb1 TaxID=1259147 RepID=UPI00106BFF49|nr:FKBP-type peptidyl-prolyl cis-trans isomerase [Cryobacterium sp. Hb1]TFD67605.1 peptidylprolyl isomerase [Cryobacterium sp. Hb1]